MLEQLRTKSGSIIIWVLFGLIIAAFVLFFGPQAGPEMLGCAGASGQYALEVKGESVSANSWRFAMNGLKYVSQIGRGRSELRPIAIDFLLEREILAQEAEERGFRISEDTVNESIASGTFYIMGRRLDGSQAYFQDGVFDYELFERFVKGALGLPSVAYAIQEQRRELLADMMRHFYLTSAVVSEEEARTNYILGNTRVSADYVKFDLQRYRDALELSEDDLESFAAAHPDLLQEEWKQIEARWSSPKERLRARRVFVAQGDDARARIEAARERIVAGAPFADVAAEVSEDPRTAARGGSIGWRSADALGYGQELVDAAKELEVGEVSEVVETPEGYHLLLIEERNEEGLSFEQKKLDLAASLAPDYYARALARRDAEAALARAKGSSLEAIFERGMPELPPGMAPPAPPAAPPAAPTEGGADEGAEDEAAEDAVETGAILREGPNVLAQIGGEPAAAETTAETTDRAPAGDEAPAEAPADEDLPDIDIEPPQLQSLTGATRNGDFVAGVGRSEALADALFDELEVGALADRVFEVTAPDGFVLVQLTHREDPDMEKFAEEAPELRENMALFKGLGLYVTAVRERCQALAQAGEVRVDPEYLTGEEGEALPYSACAYLGEQSAYEQLMSRLQR